MTNETLHTLETRRSCRAYKPEQITKEELEAVLRAGTFAPSAMNRQSAKIVVVQDAKTRAQLTRMNAAVMGTPRVRPSNYLPILDWSTNPLKKHSLFSFDRRLL